MKKLISSKNRVFLSLVGPSETENPQRFQNWLKIGNFQPELDKKHFFNNTRSHFTTLCKKVENSSLLIV